MRKVWLILAVAAIIGGCSGEGIIKTEEKETVPLAPEVVFRIIENNESEETDASWIIKDIGAQLLEAKYKSFVEAGMSEVDFGRMPENELTENIRRLYIYMEPFVE